MTMDRARQDLDAVPNLPMRKCSLDVDNILVEFHCDDVDLSHDSVSCSNAWEDSCDLEDSCDFKEIELKLRGLTKKASRDDYSILLKEGLVLNKDANESKNAVRHTKISVRGIRKDDYLASLSNKRQESPAVDKNNKKVDSTSNLRRKSRGSIDHRTLTVSSEHSHRRPLNGHLPTIEEYQRSDFEEDRLTNTRRGSSLGGKRSHSCGDVRRRGRKISIQPPGNHRPMQGNAPVGLNGFEQRSVDLERIAKKISEQKRRIRNATLDPSLFFLDNGDGKSETVLPNGTQSAAHSSLVSWDSPPKTLRSAKVASHLNAQPKCKSMPPLYPSPRSPSSKTRLIPQGDALISSTRGVFDDPRSVSKSSSLPKMPTRKLSSEPALSTSANATWRH